MKTSKYVNSIGKKFGRLTIKNIIGTNKHGHCVVECLCDCGNKWQCNISSLFTGNTSSCGCFKKENPTRHTHGLSKTYFYDIYCAMKERTNNPNNKGYKNYGARGIKLLWATFEDFHKDEYQSYLEHIKLFGRKETSIERIDNDGPYSKKNCKWATRKEQGNNRRWLRKLTVNGVTKNFQIWCNEFNLPRLRVRDRIDKLHWTPEEALGIKFRKTIRKRDKLFTLNGETKCLTDWAKIYNINPQTVNSRISRGEWTIEQALGLTLRRKPGHHISKS